MNYACKTNKLYKVLREKNLINKPLIIELLLLLHTFLPIAGGTTPITPRTRIHRRHRLAQVIDRCCWKMCDAQIQLREERLWSWKVVRSVNKKERRNDNTIRTHTLFFAIPRNASRNWSGDVWSSIISTLKREKNAENGSIESPPRNKSKKHTPKD